MDAMALLREVSEAYRSLQTLELEAALIQESGDENAGQRSERRVRFFYAAPDRMRYEPCGRGRVFEMVDGFQLHRVLTHLRGQQRYTSVPIAEMGRFPYLFDSKWPVHEEVFLFQGIGERMISAEIVRQEDGCYVVAVEYEGRPLHEGLMVNGSPVLLWVNAENRMVMRHQGEAGHRHSTEDEITWSRHEMAVRRVRVNEPIPEETFRFTPPPDAKLETGGSCGAVFGGGGFVERSQDGQRWLEHRSSHEWEGDTLVEHSKWKIRGMKLTFERRLTFSDDGLELRVDERVTGPKGEAQTSCKLPVA